MFKIFKDGELPTRGTKLSACVDLYAREDVIIGAGDIVLIPLGVSIDTNTLNAIGGEYVGDGFYEDFLNSHYLQLMLRSSLSKHLVIANGVGVIDLDYEDEIMIRVHNPLEIHSEQSFDTSGFVECNSGYIIKKGDRVAQITLLEHKSYLFGIDTEDKRTGGFGSTDKKEVS